MTRYGPCMLATLLAAALLSSALPAAEMKFSGTLNDPPPCTIHNDHPVTVDFGDHMGVNKVNGSNYLQTVDYDLTCDADSPQSGLALVLSVGSSGLSSFDTAAVNTSSPGLGIHLTVDDEPVTFSQAYPVTVDKPPVLKAVPVKDSDASLIEGAFTATATLQVIYQ